MALTQGTHKAMTRIQRHPYRMAFAMTLLVAFAMIVIGGYAPLFGLFLGGAAGAGTALVLSPVWRQPPGEDDSETVDPPNS